MYEKEQNYSNIEEEKCNGWGNLLVREPFKTTPSTTVEFLDLKTVYEKVQSRRDGGSKQRLASAQVTIKVRACAQVIAADVMVERLPMAAMLCDDITGRVRLVVDHVKQITDTVRFSIGNTLHSFL